MIYFTNWQYFRQSTPLSTVDCPKLGSDVGLLFIGHLAFGDVCDGAPLFCASLFDLESDAHRARFIESRVVHLGPTCLMDRPHREEVKVSLSIGYQPCLLGSALETVDGFFFNFSAVELFFFLAGPGSLLPPLDAVGGRRRHCGMTTNGVRRFSSPSRNSTAWRHRKSRWQEEALVMYMSEIISKNFLRWLWRMTSTVSPKLAVEANISWVT